MIHTQIRKRDSKAGILYVSFAKLIWKKPIAQADWVIYRKIFKDAVRIYEEKNLIELAGSSAFAIGTQYINEAATEKVAASSQS